VIVDGSCLLAVMQMSSSPLPSNRPHSKTLIVVAGEHGNTMAVAQVVAKRLRHRGYHVDVGDALAPSTPPPEVYQAVIIGTETSKRRDRYAISDFIARHREQLARISTGLFLLNDAHKHVSVESFVRTIRWRPTFGASLAVRSRDPFRNALRFALVTALSRLSGSVDIAPPDDVRELADAISREVGRTTRPA
jgi:menaquinone-dependent protoporphyrinogen IX oxidase